MLYYVWFIVKMHGNVYHSRQKCILSCDFENGALLRNDIRLFFFCALLLLHTFPHVPVLCGDFTNSTEPDHKFKQQWVSSVEWSSQWVDCNEATVNQCSQRVRWQCKWIREMPVAQWSVVLSPVCVTVWKVNLWDLPVHFKCRCRCDNRNSETEL
jgi:hypothetical protein